MGQNLKNITKFMSNTLTRIKLFWNNIMVHQIMQRLSLCEN